MKRLLVNLLGLAHVYPTRETDRADLINLIDSLRPVRNADLVRLGHSFDGGYLVPAHAKKLSACFSPGVSDCSDFELDCAELGMRVYLADKSVEGPAYLHDNFRFFRQNIGVTNSDGNITLENWVRLCEPDNDSLLLQMDIEGDEWKCLLSTPLETIDMFDTMVIEFHGLNRLWSKPFFDMASEVFKKILINHKCVHIHPNNAGWVQNKKDVVIPDIMEFTFSKSYDRLGLANQVPHPLDAPNVPKPDLVLPEIWRKP